jgi:beta-glucosidase
MTVVDPAARAGGLASRFPAGFRFGVATAAYQIEGAAAEDGRGPSIWDTFCAVPGAVDSGDSGAVACDHYHRWREDLDLMAELGVPSYRFSIAWPRVQPGGSGALNPAGVAFYSALVDGLLERGIEPVATLYHWDLPQALQDRGGWAARETAERFADYAGAMGEALGDRVAGWITHNEPWVVAFLGHAIGRKAPGHRDWAEALDVAHHLLVSHGLAVRALRATVPAEVPIGITLNLAPAAGATDAEADRAAAVRLDGHQNRWFLDPVLKGRYPDDLLEHYERRLGPIAARRPGDEAIIAAPIDFLGVNYYHAIRAVADPSALPLEAAGAPAAGPTTAMGWEMDPDGLRRLLERLRADYGDLPIYITENGAAFEDGPPVDGVVEDPERVAYLAEHLEALAQAIAAGVDVRRYYAWSLLDNFEWEHGYAKRFGLVHVDYATQVRTPKRSAHFYRDLIADAGREG